MKGKIVFEEHFATSETLENTRSFAGDSGKWEEFERQILDLDDERLELMDKNGIEFAILSNNAPGVQAILKTDEAILAARKANDILAQAVNKYPNRYAGFAALPMQDPDAASEELTRCVKEMGLTVWKDELDGYQGPLAGMYTGIIRSATEYILTFPCDGPFVSEVFFERMLIADNSFEIRSAHDGQRIQPVYSLLRKGLKDSLKSFIDSGQRKIDKWYNKCD